MPHPEMVLHPSLFAMLCCQTKQIGCKAKSHRYQRITGSLTLSRSTCGSLRLGCDLISPELCAYAVSFLLSFVMSVLFHFSPPKEPEDSCLWLAVGCWENAGVYFFHFEINPTVNRKLRLLVTCFYWLFAASSSLCFLFLSLTVKWGWQKRRLKWPV